MGSGRPATTTTTGGLLLPVLAGIGAVASVGIASKLAGGLLRKLVGIADPLRPSDADAGSLSRLPPIPLDRIDAHIREPDNAVVRGAERCVAWHDGKKTKTAVCVVFVHGWSACRQECAPLPEDLAAALGANLYCARLPGHGRKHPRGVLGGLPGPHGAPLRTEARPPELFLEVLDAYRVGLSLGDRVVLVGMSTGAALLTWLASLPSVRDSGRVAALVLISPAYALGHPLYPVLKNVFAAMRVWAPRSLREWLLERILGGPTKSSPALSPEHQRYTTLEYPAAAILNLLDVLWEVGAASDGLSRVTTPLLMVGNPGDRVVDFRVAASNAFLGFGDAPRKSLYALTETEHPHCVASKMLSPSALAEVSEVVIGFVRRATHHHKEAPPPAVPRRRSSSSGLWPSSRSVPTGLGGYGRSFSSLQDLTRPFLDA